MPNLMRRLGDIRALGGDPPQIRRSYKQVLGPFTTSGSTPFLHRVPGEYWERIISIIGAPVTSGVVKDRQYVCAYFQGDQVAVTAVPISELIGPSQIAQVTASIDAPGLFTVGGDSLNAEGRVLGPTAGQTIASIALTGGEWNIAWEVQLDGTVAALEENNFGLYSGATLEATSENPPTAGGPYPQPLNTIQVNFSGATVAVKAIAAGTGTAGYTAAFTATPVGNVTSYGRLPDLILPSGWYFGLETINADPGDSIASIYLVVEQFPSDYASGTEAEETNHLLREILATLSNG